MPTVAKAADLARLIERLEAVTPDSPRKWGTMTPGEMLCHLGDATASVVSRAGTGDVPRNRPILKWIALRSPLKWPPGLPTPPRVNPQPGDFEADRRRAVEGLRAFAATPGDQLAAGHGAFGRMTEADWYRWAWRHTDHHLRQFGH